MRVDTLRRAFILRASAVILHDEHAYYDLVADPGELNANALSEAERNQLLAMYESIRNQAKENAAPRDKQQPNADTSEQIRQLGYDHARTVSLQIRKPRARRLAAAAAGAAPAAGCTAISDTPAARG